MDDLAINLIVVSDSEIAADAFRLMTRKIKESADESVKYLSETAFRNSATVSDIIDEVVKRGLADDKAKVKLFCQDGQKLRDLSSPVLIDSPAKKFGLHMSGLLVCLGDEGEAIKGAEVLKAYDTFMNIIR